jgi:hypothetical protein
MMTTTNYVVFAAMIGRDWGNVSPHFVRDFLTYLEQDNPRFDRKRFIDAVIRATPIEGTTRDEIRVLFT